MELRIDIKVVMTPSSSGTRFWHKWTTGYCLKGASIWQAQYKTHFSESLTSIMRVRDIWIDKIGSNAENMLNSCVHNGKFTISLAYDLLRN